MTRQSTKAGNVLGSLMIRAAWTFDYALPIAAISAYRLIPDRARGSLFGGPSASRDTLNAIRAAGGNGWEFIKIAASNHPPRPALP